VVPAFSVYLFDLDGTLLDSAADICGAVRQVLSDRVLQAPSAERLKRFIGHHLDAFFLDILPDLTRAELDDLLIRWRIAYPARGHTATTLYPGVAEALGGLGGHRTTATTKGTPAARAILEQFGLLGYFDHVQGTDGFPHKPAPDVVLRAIQAFGARPEDCLFIGDSPLDMEAGRRAGVKTCAVRYGYGNPDDLARWTPDYWISDLRELLPATDVY
jgi:phosphoglycolate phosphatase